MVASVEGPINVEASVEGPFSPQQQINKNVAELFVCVY